MFWAYGAASIIRSDQNCWLRSQSRGFRKLAAGYCYRVCGAPAFVFSCNRSHASTSGLYPTSRRGYSQTAQRTFQSRDPKNSSSFSLRLIYSHSCKRFFSPHALSFTPVSHNLTSKLNLWVSSLYRFRMVTSVTRASLAISPCVLCSPVRTHEMYVTAAAMPAGPRPPVNLSLTA
jgi:hypothetical protein